jgi:hypothetical protein
MRIIEKQSRDVQLSGLAVNAHYDKQALPCERKRQDGKVSAVGGGGPKIGEKNTENIKL